MKMIKYNGEKRDVVRSDWKPQHNVPRVSNKPITKPARQLRIETQAMK
jgi:hypothetical protein